MGESTSRAARAKSATVCSGGAATAGSCGGAVTAAGEPTASAGGPGARARALSSRDPAARHGDLRDAGRGGAAVARGVAAAHGQAHRAALGPADAHDRALVAERHDALAVDAQHRVARAQADLRGAPAGYHALDDQRVLA